MQSLLKVAVERIYGDEQTTLTTPETFTPSTPKIAAALELAKKAHEGQFRKTGEPFYYHPIAVAQILQSIENHYKKHLKTNYVYFWSRSRDELWLKGETSGNKLKVNSISMDCDNDALLIQTDRYPLKCKKFLYN